MSTGARDHEQSTTFWHISDLHLEAPHARRCSTADPPCDRCIKAAIVERLAAALEREEPALLLLGGDIFDDDSWRHEGHPLEPLLSAAKKSKTVVVGIRGQHDASTKELKSRFPWILAAGETNEESGVFVRALPAAEQEENAKQRTASTLLALARSAPATDGRPSVLLTHINAAQFPRSERDAPRFHYYALGDMHLSRIVPLAGDAVLGNPGHLYSWFDGSGKAWPTFILKGSITRTGRVTVGREHLQGAAPNAPHTRQLYVHHKYRTQTGGELVLVNAPGEDVLRRAGLRSWRLEELRASGRAPQDIALRRVSLTYANRDELQTLIRELLQHMPDDVFVGLAKGSGNADDRRTSYASQILAGDLSAFVDACFMSTPTTQTSDAEGWAAD